MNELTKNDGRDTDRAVRNRWHAADANPARLCPSATDSTATRIAFCENGAGYGGAVISLTAFLEHIPAAFDPYIYTGIGNDEYRRLNAFGTWRHIAPVAILDRGYLEDSAVPFASMLDNLCNVAPSAMRYFYAFKRDRIGIVYLNNDPSCNLAAALAAQMAGLPMLLHARGFATPTRANQWVLSKIDHCIAVSNAVRDQLVATGLCAERCTVVPEGLDLTLFHPRPRNEDILQRLNLGPGAPVITLIGGLVDWKGQDVLLDACPQVFQAFPDAHVLLVGGAYGKDDRYAKMVTNRAKSAEMASRVTVLGARDDIPDLLSISSVVVHASTKPEPFGRTFLEGMAMGKPVIASNEGGPREVIVDGVDGLLVEPRKPELLAQAICRLLAEPAYAGGLGTAAAMKAANYSIENHSSAIADVLARLSSQSYRKKCRSSSN